MENKKELTEGLSLLLQGLNNGALTEEDLQTALSMHKEEMVSSDEKDDEESAPSDGSKMSDDVLLKSESPDAEMDIVARVHPTLDRAEEGDTPSNPPIEISPEEDKEGEPYKYKRQPTKWEQSGYERIKQ